MAATGARGGQARWRSSFREGIPLHPCQKCACRVCSQGRTARGRHLPQHLTQLDSQFARFSSTGHTERSFFHQLGSTREGEALNYYIHEKPNILGEPERSADGELVRDREGRVLLCQHPVRRWVAMLQDRFSGATADKEQEDERLRQRSGESALSFYYRVLGLAKALRIETEQAVVRKYLAGVPAQTADVLKHQVYMQLGERARLLEVAQLHVRMERTLRAFPRHSGAPLLPTGEAQSTVAHHQGRGHARLHCSGGNDRAWHLLGQRLQGPWHPWLPVPPDQASSAHLHRLREERTCGGGVLAGASRDASHTRAVRARHTRELHRVQARGPGTEQESDAREAGGS